nr:hypothetical protein [Tanacetum cinerariifolium]
QKEGGEHASASIPSETATGGAGRSTTGEDERMMIRKDPPLDQTGGLKDKKKEVSMHQLALHLKQQPGVQADLPQGLNLDNCLPVSLLLQRNLCRLPVRWRNPHIWCLTQEFWATTKLHHNSIYFKITKKSVLDLEAFREMLHISLRIPS